jgi:hypothetical protein
LTNAGLTEDQIRDKMRLQRLEQLAAKNPVTSAWKKYEKKINVENGVSDYIIEKHLKTERHRDARASTRAERRNERRGDAELHHHPNTSD